MITSVPISFSISIHNFISSSFLKLKNSLSPTSATHAAGPSTGESNQGNIHQWPYAMRRTILLPGAIITIGSSVWVEVLDSSSSSMLELWLTWIFADNHSHCELLSAISIPCPKDRISQHSYLSWLFNFLLPLLWSSLNLGEGCIRMCHFLLSNHSQHLDQLWTSALTAAYCIEQLLWLQLRAV